MNAMINNRCNSPWVYTLGTVGRGIRIDGSCYTVRAWNLRQALRETRKYVSRAWSFRLIRREHE
jgi:hypothetical protein